MIKYQFFMHITSCTYYYTLSQTKYFVHLPPFKKYIYIFITNVENNCADKMFCGNCDTFLRILDGQEVQNNSIY